MIEHEASDRCSFSPPEITNIFSIFFLSQTHALIEFLILFLLINLNDTVVTLFKVTQNTDKSDFYLIRDMKDVNLSFGHVLALDDKNKL